MAGTKIAWSHMMGMERKQILILNLNLEMVITTRAGITKTKRELWVDPVADMATGLEIAETQGLHNHNQICIETMKTLQTTRCHHRTPLQHRDTISTKIE